MRDRAMVPRGGALVASTAVVDGDVTLGDRVSVWWNAVIRGDDAPIVVGPGTNVQDLAMLHADAGAPLTVGADVTIGHHAVVHGVRVGDGALIGIGAIVLGGVEVGEGAIVAAGAVVPEGTRVPPGVVVAGVPARVLRDVRPEERDRAAARAAKYWTVACTRAGRA
jgi:carbonic anhydrase/acetyltransferase-like protein (isoleucine patch superfamily)